jgi:hypothetical protein
MLANLARMAKAAVCYHNQTRCPFCWGGAGLPPRKPQTLLQQCAVCGRWGQVRTCARCVERGFSAPQVVTVDR